jgi:hypothetical protein
MVCRSNQRAFCAVEKVYIVSRLSSYMRSLIISQCISQSLCKLLIALAIGLPQTFQAPLLSRQVATGSGCHLDSMSTSNENDVLCIGEVLINFVTNESNVSLFDVNTFRIAAGGAPANVAIGVRRLGLSSGFVGKAGNDPFGVKLRNKLTKASWTKVFACAGLSRSREQHNRERDQDNDHDDLKDLCFYCGTDRCLLPEENTLRILGGTKCFTMDPSSVWTNRRPPRNTKQYE